MTPAIEGLGLSSIVAAGSLSNCSKQLVGLGDHISTLKDLSKETGLSTQKLREYEEAGKRVGISFGETGAALQKFAENLNQQKKGKGPLTAEALIGQPADIQNFIRSLANMDIASVVDVEEDLPQVEEALAYRQLPGE